MELQQVLLTEKQVAEQTGLPITTLSHLRRTGRGIPFIKLSPGRLGRIRYRLEDVEAYLAKNPKKTQKKPTGKTATHQGAKVEKEPVTMTCQEASTRHKGITPQQLAQMCLRGKANARRYGGPSRVPSKIGAKVLFAQKVGRQWVIPVAELDRVFLGKIDT